MKRNVPSECNGCNLEERWLLHNVRHRGTYHRLCTSCVLKFHSGLFCPNCFEVYEGSSLAVNRVLCLRCPSVSHLDCVSKDVASTYVCPCCLNPNFVFFDSGASNKKRGDGELVSDGNQGAIDAKVAKVLCAAAQIASNSMSKASAVARVEAEKRAKEAALARKRAKEALEQVSSLVSKEKKGKETEVIGRVSNSASVMAAQKKFQNQFVGVDLREKEERVVGFQAPSALQGSVKNGVPIGDMDRLKGSATPVIGSQQLKNASMVNENGKSSNLTHLHKNGLQGEEKNGLSLVTPASTILQHSQNSHGGDESGGNSKAFVESAMDPLITHLNQGELVSKTNEGVLVTGSSNIVN